MVLGVWGTLQISAPYHPFSVPGFVRHVLGVIWELCHGSRRAMLRVKIASKLGAVNEEDRAKSLVGVYLVFLGFVLQSIGAVLWSLDAILVTRLPSR
jgi:hypothetical protein